MLKFALVAAVPEALPFLVSTAMDRSVDTTASSSRQYKSKLLAAKEARKLVEQDAKLLANRIALLKQEEEKAYKKITQTKRRAAEILRLRAENEARLAAKEAADKEREKESMLETSVRSDTGHREAARKVMDDQYKARQAAVKEIKNQKVEMKKELERRKQEEHLRARRMREEIKAQKEEARRRKEAAEAEAAEKRRKEYEARVAAEEEARRRTEARVHALEAMESKMIEKLRNTQVMQQKAYGELEKALGGGGSPTRDGSGSPATSPAE